MKQLRTSLALAALAGLAVAVALSGCGPDARADDSAAASPDAIPHDWSPERPVRIPTETTSTTVPPTTTTAPPPTTVVTSPPPPVVTPAPAPAPAASAPADGNGEARLLQLINGERADAGVGALQISGGARSVARTWSAEMAASGLGHNPELSADLARAGVTGWKAIGENVGRARNVDEAFRMFMESGGHRANILKASYSVVGIGVVNSGGQVWVTFDFVGY